MDGCREYRLSSCSSSTLCRSMCETSIYDTYGRDWGCLSARSACTRSVCQTELDDRSELTLLLKERRLTQSVRSNASDESTEPPNDFAADTGGSTTPLTSREPSASFDGVVSIQGTIAVDSVKEPKLPGHLRSTIGTFASVSSTSPLLPRLDNSSVPVILAKPVVNAHTITPYKFSDTPKSYRLDPNPLLSFRSYDSVHLYDSSRGHTSGRNTPLCHSWAPPPMHRRECKDATSEPCCKAEQTYVDSSDSASNSSSMREHEMSVRSAPRYHSWAPPPLSRWQECQVDKWEPCCKSEETHDYWSDAASNSSMLRRRRDTFLSRQDSSHRSEVFVVDCQRMSRCEKRSFSALSHADVDCRLNWSVQNATSSPSRYLLSSSLGGKHDNECAKVEERSTNRTRRGSMLRSQSAIGYAEATHKNRSNQVESRIMANTMRRTSSPERHLSSPFLEITRDLNGNTIGFQNINCDRILRGANLEVTEDSRGVSVGFKEDRFRASSRSHSWVPPSCKSRVDLASQSSQSWAPPLLEPTREVLSTFASSHVSSSERLDRRGASRDILRPLHPSRVSSLDRPPRGACPLSSRVASLDRPPRDAPRDILRPLPSSRVSSLDRPPREASSDIFSDCVRHLNEVFSSLLPPPDRQVRDPYAEPDYVLGPPCLPSPPRRKVSRQWSQHL